MPLRVKLLAAYAAALTLYVLLIALRFVPPPLFGTNPPHPQTRHTWSGTNPFTPARSQRLHDLRADFARRSYLRRYEQLFASLPDDVDADERARLRAALGDRAVKWVDADEQAHRQGKALSEQEFYVQPANITPFTDISPKIPALLVRYEATLPQREFVSYLQANFSEDGRPMTPHQAEELIASLHRHQIPPPALNATREQCLKFINQSVRAQQAVLQDAEKLLSPEQLEALDRELQITKAQMLYYNEMKFPADAPPR